MRSATHIQVHHNARYLMTEHSKYYYDYNRNDLSRKNPFNEVTVGEDGVLDLPSETMEELGWKEGDQLIWTDNNDGSFSLKKYEKTND